MWKIIKSNLETVQIKKEKFTLWMKWKFTIEFVNDTFGPYDYKFAREDCYYIDGLEDRGSIAFSLKNKEFQNTEIFLENDDIIICTGERTNLSGESKSFIDVINIKTEKKQRIITEEVNLIYNSQKDIIINVNLNWTFKTLTLDSETLEIKEEKEEKLLSFFKCVYNKNEQKWYVLDFIKTGETENDGYFELKKIIANWEPKNFNREEYIVNWNINIWELSCN